MFKINVLNYSEKYQKTEIYYDHNEQSLPDCMISYLQGQL